jgi:hypothetical protein
LQTLAKALTPPSVLAHLENSNDDKGSVGSGSIRQHLLNDSNILFSTVSSVLS